MSIKELVTDTVELVTVTVASGMPSVIVGTYVGFDALKVDVMTHSDRLGTVPTASRLSRTYAYTMCTRVPEAGFEITTFTGVVEVHRYIPRPETFSPPWMTQRPAATSTLMFAPAARYVTRR